MLYGIAWIRGVLLRGRLLLCTAVVLYSATVGLNLSAWLSEGEALPHLLAPLVYSAIQLAASLVALGADFARRVRYYCSHCRDEEFWVAEPWSLPRTIFLP